MLQVDQVDQALEHMEIVVLLAVQMLQHVTTMQMLIQMMDHVHLLQQDLTVMVIVYQEVQLQLICSTLGQMVVDQ